MKFESPVKIQPLQRPANESQREKLIKTNSLAQLLGGFGAIGFGIFWLANARNSLTSFDTAYSILVLIVSVVAAIAIFISFILDLKVSRYDLSPIDEYEKSVDSAIKSKTYDFLKQGILIALIVGMSMPHHLLIGTLWIVLGGSQLYKQRLYGK